MPPVREFATETSCVDKVGIRDGVEDGEEAVAVASLDELLAAVVVEAERGIMLAILVDAPLIPLGLEEGPDDSFIPLRSTGSFNLPDVDRGRLAEELLRLWLVSNRFPLVELRERRDGKRFEDIR